MSLDIRPLSGAELDAALDDLARLRIAVFRDWPYLYAGDLEYERTYMRSYAGNDRAVMVGAFDGPTLVGAATGTPMEDHDDDLSAPLTARGIAPEHCFYCAESVLLPAYRGQGVGHRFFDERERHARALGRRQSVFCAVIRPDDHPARPDTYRPLDGFWRKRGYAPMQGAVARLAWRDIGASGDTVKPLQLWSRLL